MDAELLPPPGAAADPPAQPAARAPYVGPRAFRPGERLYGRDREARELMDVLVAERIVLCHSPSGAGKTSLIQALLAPRLAEARFAVYGPTRVGSEMGAEGAAAGANRYVLSALIGMEKGRPDPLPLDRLAALTLAGYLDLRAADDGDHDPVLIFDQFEEILTIDSNDVDAKTEFFRQIGAALRPRHRWALFAMREEFVAALDAYVHLVPTQLASRYPLQLLDARGARDAIEKPAADASVPFTGEALDRLVDNLLRAPQPGSPDGVLGRWVEPVQLQVVCTRLWQKLKPDTKEIGTDLVGGVDDVDTALADYYAESVARVAGETGVSERRIRRWFDTALVSGGVRAQVARGGESVYGLNESVVTALVDSYLVRREERRTSIWYELAHDRLMVPVKNDNARWFYDRASDLQRQAELWISTGKPAGGLFRGTALRDAQRWVSEHPDEKIEEIDLFLGASETAWRLAKTRLRLLLSIALVVFVAAVVIAWQNARLKRQNAIFAEYARSNRIGGGDQSLIAAVQTSLSADSALQTTGDNTIQPGVTVWYFPKDADPDIMTGLRLAGYPVVAQRAQNRVPTNWVLYGDSVGASTLRLLGYTLLRVGAPLKGICPLRNQAGRKQVIQVLGISDRDEEPPVTVEQVSAITDTRRQVNCEPAPVIVLQYYGGERERQRVEALRESLIRARYRVPGVENRNERIDVVRYFSAEDRMLADSLAVTAARLLNRPDPIRVQFYSADVPARRLELWVDLTDRRPASAP